MRNARALLKAMGIKVKDMVTAVGPRAPTICAQGANHRLIVVTDEGRTRLQRALRGSTAYEVVKSATTSVLDVR